MKTDKTIIDDLPEKLEMNVFTTLMKEQASLYRAVVKETETALDSGSEGIERKGLVLATLMKLKQICNHPAVENQATDRAFRIGQTRRVQVHKFVCMGTVEERINDTRVDFLYF